MVALPANMFKRRFLEPAILGFLIFLLAACGKTETEIVQTPDEQGAGILPGVPALSELAGTPPPDISQLPALDPDQIALGQILYSNNCAECHGQNLEGEADWQLPNEDDSFRSPPHDDTGHTWHHTDQVLIEAIRLGGTRLPENLGASSNMPAFGAVLTEAEVTAVLTYIKSTWPEDIRAIQWEMTARQQNQ